MEFKLSDGPWAVLFEGKIQGHEIEIAVNPKNIMLVFVYESDGGKRTGCLLQCYNIFLAKGNLETFIDTLPRKAMSLTKHSNEQTFKFLLLDSGTTYSAYEENAVIKETDALMAKVNSFASLVKEVSTAYDIDLFGLEEGSEDEKMEFHSIPLLSLLVSPVTSRLESAGSQGTSGEIMLGITKKGTIVKEPFDFFDRVLISGGEKNDRMHLFHVLIESSLLSNIPAIVVDWSNRFTGLHFPNENAEELKKYRVETDPLGFPIKFFRFGQELKADLGFLDPAVFLEAFGLSGTPQGAIIEQAFSMGKSQSVAELIDKVRGLPEGEQVTSFKKKETERILSLIESIYPGLFEGSNPLQEISEGWVRGIGRANILLFDGQDKRKNMLVLQSVVSGIFTHFRAKGKTKKLKSLLFVSGSERAVPEFGASRANKKITEDIASAREFGVGSVVEAKDKANISKRLKDNTGCYLAVIQGNDVGVIVAKRKNYRVLVRPGLSKCTEQSLRAELVSAKNK